MASYDEYWSFPKEIRQQLPKEGEAVYTEIVDPDEEDEDEGE